MSNTNADSTEEQGLVMVAYKGETVQAYETDILEWMVSDLANILEELKNLSDIIADMEKVYQSIQRVAAKKGLTFLMLLPDITAKVSGEPVDLFEVLDVKAENAHQKEVRS